MPKQLITHKSKASVLGHHLRQMKPIRLQAGPASPGLETVETASQQPGRRIEPPELLPEPHLNGPFLKQPSSVSLRSPVRQALAGSSHVAVVNVPCAPPFFFFFDYDTTLYLKLKKADVLVDLSSFLLINAYRREVAL
jgi:hypothetical protein